MKLIPDWALEKLGYRRFEAAPVTQGEEEEVSAEVVELASPLRTAYWPEAVEPATRASHMFSMELPPDMHRSLCEWFIMRDIWYISHTPEIQNGKRQMEGGQVRMYVICGTVHHQQAWARKERALQAELRAAGLI